MVLARDPTQPPVALQLKRGNSPQSQLTLDGIFDKKGHVLAIINGKMVTSGDKVSGFKVLQISPKHVMLELIKGDKQISLSLTPSWKSASS